MREAYGKLVYDSLAEVVDPSHTAVVVVDMQNDLVAPGGLADRNGAELEGNRRIIDSLRVLLQGAREASIPVVYIMYTIHPGLPTVTPAWVYHGVRLFSGTLLSPAKKGISSLEGLFEGSWGWEVIEELAPEEGDVLVQKHHLGGFWGHQPGQDTARQRHRDGGRHRHRHLRLRLRHGGGRRRERLLHRLRPGLRHHHEPPGPTNWA